MGVDYAEKERQFIDALEEDTGRNLAAWMNAISAQNIKERNALIDWLRLQGFTFARASWMERIHHNGGKLIYAGDKPPVAVEPLQPVTGARRTDLLPTEVAASAESDLVPANNDGPSDLHLPADVAAGVASAGEEAEQLFESAKAYRALARFVAQEIEKLVPGCAIAISDAVASFAAPLPFAALQVTPKGLKLYLDAEASSASHFKKADQLGLKLRQPPYQQMLALTDARAVDTALKQAIISSAVRSRS